MTLLPPIFESLVTERAHGQLQKPRSFREKWNRLRRLSAGLRRASEPCTKRAISQRKAALAMGLVLMLTYQSCSRNPTGAGQASIRPPFLAADQVVTKEAFLNISEPAGMTGDQYVFGMWFLQATEATIDAATSYRRVSEKLYWRCGQSGELQRVFRFFEAYDEFHALMATNADVLNDKDIRYAFLNLSVSRENETVRYATLWVCSPTAKKLLFLSGH